MATRQSPSEMKPWSISRRGRRSHNVGIRLPCEFIGGAKGWEAKTLGKQASPVFVLSEAKGSNRGPRIFVELHKKQLTLALPLPIEVDTLAEGSVESGG